MTAFVKAYGGTADSTATADVFIGVGDSVGGVMAGINSACHALIADVAAADQAKATAAQAQATATQGAVHQIGQSVKYEETAVADAEHAATSTVSDAIRGFINGEADAQTHAMISAVTG